MPVQPGYQETMVPFGAWLPDQGKNTAKPGFPLFWVNGSPVDLDDALNVVWTGGAYRPFAPPLAVTAKLVVTPTDVHAAYAPAYIVVAGSGAQAITASATQFFTGNGSATTAQLNVGGVPVQNPTVTAMHQTDWQGRVALSSAPRTNYALSSQNMLGTGWNINTETVTNNNPGAPDGTATLNKVVISTQNIYHVQVHDQTGVPNGLCSMRVYINPSGAPFTTVWLADQNASNVPMWYVVLDSTGKVTANSGNLASGKANITPGPNGTFLVSIQGVVTAGIARIVSAFSDSGASPSYTFTGNGTDSYDLWGLMFSPGIGIDQFGIYIPTTSAPVTVTDYAVDTSGNVTFGQAPASGATLDWDGSGTAGGALLYTQNYGAPSWAVCGSGYTAAQWKFAQYTTCLYATDGHDPIQVMDLTNIAGGFTALAATTAPVCQTLGMIGDFLIAGNIVSSPIGAPAGQNVIEWCGLAAPATWSVPNTQAARADQSGAQSLPGEYGPVQFIASGQALGMVFQQTGITRVQYVGGDIVFSFYTYERKRGLVTPRAAAQVGNTVFYLSGDGFYATDGTEVQPIGYSKVNRWFIADCTNLQAVRCAVDIPNSLVIWAYPSASNASGYGQIVYNFAEGNWTRGNYACPLLFQDYANGTAPSYAPALLDATNTVNRFDGVPTDSELTTKDFRFDPSHHSLVVSLRVLCDNASATAGICGRDQDSDPQTFVGYGAPEPVSRQISVRADGYMHSSNVKIPGAFTYAQGIGYKYVNRGRR